MSEALYHGSVTQVEHIDLSHANPKRDFGAGFYTTSSLEQAIRFSKIVARRQRLTHGIVSKYRYDEDAGIHVSRFAKPDLEWLDFVLLNRGHDVAAAMPGKADLIIGPVANDQVGQTLNLLMTGAYGDPFTQNAKTFALSLLLAENLVDQWVFKTTRAVRCLEFVEAEEYGL